MDLKIVPVTIDDIAPWFGDFEKKSKCFELTTEMVLMGLQCDSRLVGYFVILPHMDHSVDIVQGYLERSAQHGLLAVKFMQLLEGTLKTMGFKSIRLLARRSFRAYAKFMRTVGFVPQVIVFQKEV